MSARRLWQLWSLIEQGARVSRDALHRPAVVLKAAGVAYVVSTFGVSSTLVRTPARVPDSAVFATRSLAVASYAPFRRGSQCAGPSMKPSLLCGDVILLDRFSVAILDREPAVGSVVMLKAPNKANAHVAKRVVARVRPPVPQPASQLTRGAQAGDTVLVPWYKSRNGRQRRVLVRVCGARLAAADSRGAARHRSRTAMSGWRATTGSSLRTRASTVLYRWR